MLWMCAQLQILMVSTVYSSALRVWIWTSRWDILWERFSHTSPYSNKRGMRRKGQPVKLHTISMKPGAPAPGYSYFLEEVYYERQHALRHLPRTF